MKTLVREKNFRVAIIELGDTIGFIVEYRRKKYYIPPVVTEDKITLPIKYARFFDPTVFPEIVPAPYGRTRG